MDKETAAAFRDLLRIGKVASTTLRTARVEFPDTTNADGKSMVSGELQVLQKKTYEDKEYWMPDIGELVLCAFLGNGSQAGFILGATFNEKDLPPKNCEGKWVKEFADGTRLEYDRDGHKLDIKLKEGDLNLKCDGTVNVEAEEVNVNSPKVNLGTNASMGVIHEKSPCPLYGVCHLNQSQTTKTAL
jgi:phage baseplate assembly protein V